MARIKLTQKKIILGMIPLFIIGGGVWYLSSVESDKQEVDQEVASQMGAVGVEAAERANDGDVDGALQYYDERVQAEDDNNKKVDLLLGKASIAAAHRRYDDALDAAKQAESLSPESATVTLAKLYEARGDKEEARKYYKKVLDRAGVDGREGDRWLRKVEELSS